MLFRRPPPPEKTEWESLCNQYQTLIDGLRRELADKQVDWSKDEKLAGIPEKVKLASYPYTIMPDEGKLYIREIIDHPEYAEQQKTQDALKTIEEIKSFFDPNSPDSWPSLSEIVSSADKFKIRNWQEPAAYLLSLIHIPSPRD